MTTAQRFFAPLLALTLTAGTLTAVAQTKTKDSSPDKKATSKFHRLPPHYGKLELTEEQVAEIYKIRQTYGEKIEALQKELEELRTKQNDETKGVLTRTQVTAYNKLVADSGTAGKSEEKSEDKTGNSGAKKGTAKKKKSDDK